MHQETIYQGKWLNFNEVEASTSDGTKFKWEYVSRV